MIFIFFRLICLHAPIFIAIGPVVLKLQFFLKLGGGVQWLLRKASDHNNVMFVIMFGSNYISIYIYECISFSWCLPTCNFILPWVILEFQSIFKKISWVITKLSKKMYAYLLTKKYLFLSFYQQNLLKIFIKLYYFWSTEHRNLTSIKTSSKTQNFLISHHHFPWFSWVSLFSLSFPDW